MKTLIWIIIVAALIFGAMKLYKSMSKPEPAAAPAPATETTTAASSESTNKSTTEKPNSEKGIKNWRAVKKVRDLNEQHNKDLMDNM